jgi:hypothetical protein
MSLHPFHYPSAITTFLNMTIPPTHNHTSLLPTPTHPASPSLNVSSLSYPLPPLHSFPLHPSLTQSSRSTFLHTSYTTTLPHASFNPSFPFAILAPHIPTTTIPTPTFVVHNQTLIGKAKSYEEIQLSNVMSKNTRIIGRVKALFASFWRKVGEKSCVCG